MPSHYIYTRETQPSHDKKKIKLAFTFFVDDQIALAYIQIIKTNKGERPMTYDEAIEATVTKREALAEVKAHGIDPEDFLEDMGNHDTYAGSDVLAWLGY
jgi:hypothetical protein